MRTPMKKICAVALSIALALMLSFILSGCGFLAIALEEPLAKHSMDNPYVNAQFDGWHETALGQHIHVLIPDGWTLSDCGTHWQILDRNGEIVAYSALFDYENVEFETQADFFAVICGTEVAETETVFPGGVTSSGNASYYEITLDIDEADRLCCLMLYDNSDGVTAGKGALMVFPTDNGIPYETQLEIIGAISFSHEYPD